MQESMVSLVCEFDKVYDTHRTEGKAGIENLLLLIRSMGYKDIQQWGMFHKKGISGAYSDIFEFLEDNPGCIEAIKEWICDQEIEEWKANIESYLPEKELEEEEIEGE